ncbi:hypothetical protein BV25DRAFT_1910786 [Artomyces pyxidatus]|uniref:Uncharacterized protein n=1 Tax=Artomyces pyxidatus TaxID=48021 RepID=A0ACB8TL08_9AGAM|nr:hypothetical protein BV25DRAFT_1910786 [Artomyces pyxidatus]
MSPANQLPISSPPSVDPQQVMTIIACTIPGGLIILSFLIFVVRNYVRRRLERHAQSSIHPAILPLSSEKLAERRSVWSIPRPLCIPALLPRLPFLRGAATSPSVDNGRTNADSHVVTASLGSNFQMKSTLLVTPSASNNMTICTGSPATTLVDPPARPLSHHSIDFSRIQSSSSHSHTTRAPLDAKNYAVKSEQRNDAARSSATEDDQRQSRSKSLYALGIPASTF